MTVPNKEIDAIEQSNREQYIVSQIVSACILAVDSLYCSKENESEASATDLEKIADLILAKTGNLRVDNLVALLNIVQDKAQHASGCSSRSRESRTLS